MNFSLLINSSYTSVLTKEQVIEVLKSLDSQKQFGAFRIDEFVAETSENGFYVGRNTSGLDGFTIEEYPIIEGYFTSEEPFIINIVIIPNYFAILFFSIFVLTFVSVGLFIDKITINEVLRNPTINERLMVIGIGGVIPGVWCYLGHIRPINKAHKWIIEKLKLNTSNGNGN